MPFCYIKHFISFFEFLPWNLVKSRVFFRIKPRDERTAVFSARYLWHWHWGKEGKEEGKRCISCTSAAAFPNKEEKCLIFLPIAASLLGNDWQGHSSSIGTGNGDIFWTFSSFGIFFVISLSPNSHKRAWGRNIIIAKKFALEKAMVGPSRSQKRTTSPTQFQNQLQIL